MKSSTLQLAVKGMTCNNCARSVELKLASTPGVTKATVNLKAERAHVEYDADLVKPEVLASEALTLMEKRRITSVIVVDAQRKVLGVVHLHDLWGLQLV